MIIPKIIDKYNLRGADFSGAYLTEADFSGAYLRGADLSEADLRRADLSGADLSGADLRGADLSEADLRRADLSGVNLIGAILNEAKFDNPVFFIKGSRDIVQCIEIEIRIGCEVNDIDFWIENYKQIGEKNNYTDEQIQEYYNYILMCKNLHECKSEV